MAENGANGLNGNAGRDGRDAKSDPSALATDALHLEILHLRELIEARLDNADHTAIATQAANQKALEAAAVASTTAIEAALAASDKAVLELDSSIARRITAIIELTDSKFITYRTLLDSQSEKVSLALDAADKAVSKAEQYNNAQFKTMSEKIDDLKSYQSSTVGRFSATPTVETRVSELIAEVNGLRNFQAQSIGKGVGATNLWAFIAGGIGLAIALILMGLRIAGH